MSDAPKYYSPAALREVAGVSKSAFTKHQLEHINVGNIRAARVEVEGLGIRYLVKKCQEYIELVRCPSRVLVKQRPPSPRRGMKTARRPAPLS